MRFFVLMLMVPCVLLADPAERMIGEMGCAACHIGLPIDDRVKKRSPSLTDLEKRFSSTDLYSYLLSPRPSRDKELGKSRMPNYRFRAEESLALTLFLIRDDEGLKELKKRYPNANEKMGRRIYGHQNCSGCHEKSDNVKRSEMMAPFLLNEGPASKKEWLMSFLKNPHSVRPSGFIPGTGSRMPDFGLSDGEASSIANWLMKKKMTDNSEKASLPKVLSHFSRKKAEHLIEKRYSCLGCHQLNGRGGRIGPDLSSVGKRRTYDYIRGMIENPQHVAVGGGMPKVSMPPKNVELLSLFLAEQKNMKTQEKAVEINPISAEPVPAADKGRKLYGAHCASCHGVDGNGNGFNAQYLDPKPSALSGHGMSKMSDDSLFDMIHGGGYIFDKSPAMPPWGSILSDEEIKSLVDYLREISKTKAPKWSE